jgi:hypothetical protein
MALGIIIISAICYLLSGICKAVTNTLSHHFFESPFSKMNPNFWDAVYSWKNKYKEDLKTPRFFGSTTFFVWTTYGWHLFDMLHLTLLQYPFALLSSFHFGNYWLSIPILFAIKIVCGIPFETLTEDGARNKTIAVLYDQRTNGKPNGKKERLYRAVRANSGGT